MNVKEQVKNLEEGRNTVLKVREELAKKDGYGSFLCEQLVQIHNLFAGAIETIEYLISQLPDEENAGWRTFEDNPPGEHDAILLCLKDNSRGVTSNMFGTYDISVGFNKKENMLYGVIDGNYYTDEVYGWKPLPPTMLADKSEKE